MHPPASEIRTARSAHKGPGEILRAFFARLRASDPAQLPATLAAAVSESLGYASVALLLARRPRGDYTVQGVSGDLPASLVGQTVAEEALPPALQRPGGDGGDPSDPIRLRGTLPGLADLPALVVVPLRHNAALLGFLVIGARPSERPYSPADFALLTLLAEATMSALRAAEVAARYAHSLRQLQILNHLGAELSANLDVEAVCLTVYEHLRQTLDFDSFFVARYDETVGMLVFPFGIDEGERYTLSPVPLSSGVSSAIFETGRPLVIDDLTQGVAHLGIEKRPDAFGTQKRSRSWMGVPMLAKHRTVGVLAVQSYTPNLYSHEQVQFLSSVANLVASALENARLFSKTDTALSTRVTELSALEEIARLLNGSLDLDRIINLVVARAVETTRAGAGIMALFDPGSQTLRLLGQIGYTQDLIRTYSGHPLPISEGIIGRAVREDRSLLVRDVTGDPDYIEALAGARSQLVVLVRRGGQVLGALSLESTELDGFTQEHVNFIEHLAEHAAIAVDNARRYERERRQNETLTRRAGELAAILHIGNALRAGLALDDVLTQIAEGVRHSLGFNVAILSLLEVGPPPWFRRVAAVGLDEESWRRLRAEPTPYEEGLRLMQPRFQVSQSYFISHLYNMVTHLESYYRPQVGPRNEQEWHADDMLIVPLRDSGGQLVGTLSVDDPVDGQLPTRATIETLEIFANQAAAALENARLFEEQRDRLRELRLLQELGVRLAATLDPMELLNEVARSAVTLFDVHASTAVLLEDGANPRAPVGAVACSRQNGGLELVPYPLERLTRLNEELSNAPGLILVPDTVAAGRSGLITAGIHALIGIQLQAGSRLEGALYLLDSAPRAFSDHDQQLLRIFATQAAVAIQNARLFEEEAHRVRDLTLLQDVGVQLTATLDIAALLQESVRLAIRLLAASSSGVLLVDETGQKAFNVRCWSREGGVVETATYESTVRPGGLTDAVMRTGEPVTIADTLSDPRTNPVMLTEGIRSLVAVPIRVTGQKLGVLFVNGYQPRAFASHEQQLLQVFANQVAVAVQNARLFEERRAFEARLIRENDRMARELVTARATQRQMLPQMPRYQAGLTMHALCLPAMEVGGDYFDVLPLGDGRLALALGDVTGKGTSAVMLTAMVKSALLSQVIADPHPVVVLAALNALALEYMQGQLMTFFYGVYDPRARTLTYDNAGHLYPYLRRADGTLEELAHGGLPLGAALPATEAPATVTLAPGDLLVLFSDGIVEAMNPGGTLFGFDRLERLLREVDSHLDPRLIVEDLVDRVHAFADGAPQDDVTLLLARCDE